MIFSKIGSCLIIIHEISFVIGAAISDVDGLKVGCNECFSSSEIDSQTSDQTGERLYESHYGYNF